MAITPNTTCDIYRAGQTPPATPSVAGVPLQLKSCFDQGRECGETESQQFRFTAIALVNFGVDIRDDFNYWAGNAGNRDTIYVPDKNGMAYVVNFVQQADTGTANQHYRVYLDRKSVTWPWPTSTSACAGRSWRRMRCWSILPSPRCGPISAAHSSSWVCAGRRRFQSSIAR